MHVAKCGCTSVLNQYGYMVVEWRKCRCWGKTCRRKWNCECQKWQ